MRAFGRDAHRHRRMAPILLGWSLACLAAASALAMDAVEGQGPQPASRGNPLWAVPLDDLAATRERPIFSPSRRPPPPAVVATPTAPPPQATVQSNPPGPPLALIGTVLNARGSYGLFLDPATKTVTRLRTGEVHDGWTLRSVGARDAMLQKDRSTAMLTLPPRDAGGSATRPSDRPAVAGARVASPPTASSVARALASRLGRPPMPEVEPDPFH